MTTPVVAISGANGYVGSIIARALRPATEVIGLVRTPRDDRDVAWSFGDNATALADVLRQRGVTHLVHAAWDMKAARQREVEQVCVEGSLGLLAAADEAGVDRVMFISTISAFAGARSLYGRAKLKVEQEVLSRNGVVLRLGLVYGEEGAGVFGNIRKMVRRAHIVPVIGDGSALQYLLHEHTLAELAARAIGGEFDRAAGPLSVAYPQGVAFRDLVAYVAEEQGRRIWTVGLPWRLLFAGLWAAEALGINSAFRSDSVISFVFQDRRPDFSLQAYYGIRPPQPKGMGTLARRWMRR